MGIGPAVAIPAALEKAGAQAVDCADSHLNVGWLGTRLLCSLPVLTKHKRNGLHTLACVRVRHATAAQGSRSTTSTCSRSTRPSPPRPPTASRSWASPAPRSTPWAERSPSGELPSSVIIGSQWVQTPRHGDPIPPPHPSADGEFVWSYPRPWVLCSSVRRASSCWRGAATSRGSPRAIDGRWLGRVHVTVRAHRHPLGCTGARQICTLLHQVRSGWQPLRRRARLPPASGSRYDPHGVSVTPASDAAQTHARRRA
jgi:hypothetical protein